MGVDVDVGVGVGVDVNVEVKEREQEIEKGYKTSRPVPARFPRTRVGDGVTSKTTPPRVSLNLHKCNTTRYVERQNV